MDKSTAAVRRFAEGDPVDDLTELLHRAYARLGAMGLNFTAVDQSPEVTAHRIARGTCFIAELDGQIVGTLTVEPSYPDAGCETYRRQGVAIAHQFAVEPSLQGMGIGSLLLDAALAWAADRGCEELAVDTAEPAQHLIDYYRRRGFETVDRIQWRGKTYESVVMTRPVAAGRDEVRTP